MDLGVVLNQGAVSVAGRRGKRPVLGQLAAAPPASVMQTGRGFWAKGGGGLFTTRLRSDTLTPQHAHVNKPPRHNEQKKTTIRETLFRNDALYRFEDEALLSLQFG